MKFTIDKDAFQKAMAGVQGVVDRRGTMPILSHVLLTPNETGLSVAGTDLELYYRGHAPAQITEPGSGIAVSAAKLFSLLKELSPGEIEGHTTDKHNLALTKGESRYTLHGLSADQYPDAPQAQGDMVEVKAKDLKEMIGKVAYSISVDDLQYHLASVLLEQDDGKPLRMVSTDGHRLTLIDRDTGQIGGPDPMYILMPRKGAAEIAKFIEGEMVKVGLSSHMFFLQDGERQLSIRLMDKKFPDYQRIIPEAWAHTFTINRVALIEGLKRLMVLSSERFKMVTFEMGIDHAFISFESPEEGQGSEAIPVINRVGDVGELPLIVFLNARYLLEPLLNMTGDAVALEINRGDTPIRVIDSADRQYFSLIMPASL